MAHDVFAVRPIKVCKQLTRYGRWTKIKNTLLTKTYCGCYSFVFKTTNVCIYDDIQMSLERSGNLYHWFYQYAMNKPVLLEMCIAAATGKQELGMTGDGKNKSQWWALIWTDDAY